MNDYAEEINELEQLHTFTKLLHVILDVKDEMTDFNKVRKNQFQN